MPEKQQFDPRRAALYHAGRAKAPTSMDAEVSDFASAIACGLVYVGDQLAAISAALNTEGSLFDNRLNTIGSALERLDVTVNDRLLEISEAV
jgi:hypothetical protein